MKKYITTFLIVIFSLFFSNLHAQQAAIFSKKVIKNMHQESFSIAIGGNNSFPKGGTFIDSDGNYYLYGSYEGTGKNNKIDNIYINGLESGKFLLIKFDKNHQAVWGYTIGGRDYYTNIKVLEGPDGYIYIFATSHESFAFGSFVIPKNTITGERSTFVVKINPKTGIPIEGQTLPSNQINYSWFIQDALFDDTGNLYVAMESFKSASSKPDSIRFEHLSKYWKENNKSSSGMVIIAKLDKNLDPIWMRTIGAATFNASIKLSYVNEELIICGYVMVNEKQWKKVYFEDELITDIDFNAPHGQGANGFLIKLDSNGTKKWLRPWLTKLDVAKSPGVLAYDMKTDPKGNIYCFLLAADIKTKLDTSWFTPTIYGAPKMAKFNPDGYMEWMREVNHTRTFADYPKTISNTMFVDRYGNSYYNFLLPNDFQKFSIDSIEYSQPHKWSYPYWGLLKLDTEGNAVDAIFPDIPSKKQTLHFYNSFKITNVADNGTIYMPLTVLVGQDSFYVFKGDTLFMDYDASQNRLLGTWHFMFTEITTKSQMVSEYRHPCSNGNDGFIHLKVIGGAKGHSLKWDDGSTGLKLDNLSSGTYVATLYDSFSKQTTVDTFILTNPKPLYGKVIIKDDTNNLSQGSIALNMKGGFPPYTYQWNNPGKSTTPVIDKLASGSYTVTVTDHNQCTWDTTITVNNYTHSIKDMLDELSIYPNPSKDGYINIKYSNPISEAIEVFILDAKGQECFYSIYRRSGSSIHESIPIRLQKGNYMVKIMDGKKQLLRKISIL